MPQETTEAVVIRGVDFSETSRIVTLLTPGRGRVAAMARGARRKGSATGPALDTFNRIEAVLYWKDGRGVQAMGEVTLIDGFPGIKRDLERGAWAAFPLEVAYKVAHENEPSQAFYAALLRGLESMAAWPGAARDHAGWQAMRLLAAAGFAPSLEACCRCGAALAAAETGFAWDGGGVCGRCAADRRLAPAAMAALRAWLDSETCPAVTAGGAAFGALRAYAAHQLETDFRSLRVIDRMFEDRAP